MAEPSSQSALKQVFNLALKPGVLLQIGLQLMKSVAEQEGDDNNTNTKTWSDMTFLPGGLMIRVGNSSKGIISTFYFYKPKSQSPCCDTSFRLGFRLDPLHQFLENKIIGGSEITMFQFESYPPQIFFIDNERANLYTLETMDVGENMHTPSPKLKEGLCLVIIDCDKLRGIFEEILDDEPVTIEVTKEKLLLTWKSSHDDNPNKKDYACYKDGVDCNIMMMPNKESEIKYLATVCGRKRLFSWITTFLCHQGVICIHNNNQICGGNFMSLTLLIKPQLCHDETAPGDHSKDSGAMVFYYYPPQPQDHQDLKSLLSTGDEN